MGKEISQERMIELGTRLLGVTNVNDYFNAVADLVPRICQADYYNLLIANPKANLYLRHFSPGFPIQIFTDYASRSAKSDLMLQLAVRKKAGEIVHLRALSDHPNPPAGWGQLVDQVRVATGIIDCLAVLLRVGQDGDWGAGLSLYRASPSPPFSTSSAGALASLGALLAAGFTNAWDQAMRSSTQETLTRIFFGFGNLAFLVGGNATPVQLDDETARALRIMYHEPADGTGIPSALTKVLHELIWLFIKKEHVNLASKETPSPGGTLRVYLSPRPGLTGTGDIFSVVVMCDPGFANLESLARIGLTPREIETLEYLQRGLNNREIARILSVSDSTVKFHMKNIGEKLGASGRSEILARAISQSHELAVIRGMTEKPPAP